MYKRSQNVSIVIVQLLFISFFFLWLYFKNIYALYQIGSNVFKRRFLHSSYHSQSENDEWASDSPPNYVETNIIKKKEC